MAGPAVALAFMLAACGGSSSTMTKPPPKPPPEKTVDMSSVSAGARKDTGTLEIAAGAKKTLGDVTYSCAAGDTGCTVTVKADGTATSTGGTVTAADSDRYTAAVAAAAAAEQKAAEEAAAAKRAKEEAEKKQAAAALKLYQGIKKRIPSGSPLRNAEFSDKSTSGGTSINKKATLDVIIIGAAAKVSLTKDDMEVDPLHDWNGSKYSLTTDKGETYVARVYDNETPEYRSLNRTSRVLST